MHRRPRLALAFTLSALAAAAGAQTSPIVAHWLLDETTGSTALDSGPFANVGTLVNFAGTPWVTGQLGNALQFDGVDDYVQVASTGGLPLYDGRGTPLAVTFWVKAPAQSDRRVLSEQATSPANSGPLFTLGSGSGSTLANGQLRVYIRADDLQVVANQTTNGIVFDDLWHHVAYVDVAGRVRIWIDGVLDTTFDYSRWAGGPLSTLRGSFALDSVTMGAVVRNNTVAAPLQGLVDDLRLYRSALTTADVQSIMTGGQASLCAPSIGGYGTGCGAGPLDLVATGSSSRGQTIWLELLRGEVGALAAFCIGTGVVAPVDLSPFGFAGCTFYNQSSTCSLTGAVLPNGSSTVFALTVPNNPALDCLLVTIQGVTLGAAVEFSPAAIAQIGQ